MRRSNEFVRSDPLLLRRILQNLVNNALRYARRGGVLVGCRKRGDFLRIEVSDTGPGIASDRREAIWEEFQRGGTIGADHGGFGLGLSIVRRLAAALEHPIDLCFAHRQWLDLLDQRADRQDASDRVDRTLR